ncbi:hypothetical protein EJB05_41825, partial [Eragrostis curvula]
MEVGGGSVSLPEEIIFDVLSWLPVKSLFRFWRVSKGWRALISDPVFVAAHKSRAALLLVCSFAACELRVMDTDGNVLRVLKDVAGTALTATRLDLVCVDEGWLGARVIDPATGRVATIIWRSTARLGKAAPSGDYKIVCLLDHACDGCTVSINGVIYVLPHGVHEHEGLWNRTFSKKGLCNRIRVSTDKKGAMLQLYDSNTGTCTDVVDMPEEFEGGITLYTGSLLIYDWEGERHTNEKKKRKDVCIDILGYPTGTSLTEEFIVVLF